MSGPSTQIHAKCNLAVALKSFGIAGPLALLCAFAPWRETARTGETLVAVPIQEPYPDKIAPHPKGYVCVRAVAPPRLDGSLSDLQWSRAAWTEDFQDIEGNLKPKPRFRTRAKMLWDAHYLYIGAEMEELDVWATLTEHDSVIFQDNDFEVFIDPNGDNHLYGEIEVNAFGTEWDLLLPKPYKDGGPAINGWEIPGLKVAVHVDGRINEPGDRSEVAGLRSEGGIPGQRDEGWSVEIAIPWKALGEIAGCDCPPKPGDQWRINFSRVEWHVDIVEGKYKKRPNLPEDNWVWSPQGVIDMHRPEHWGYLQFSEREPGAEPFRPDPDWAARDLLHKVYYAQRRYREAHGRFTDDLKQLLTAQLAERAKGLRAQVTDTGFEASLPSADGKRRLRIREDSRIWTD
ncbi:MAG: carbohydrate-binding family 9-like protein [Armatimonadetes bacterium]|nr:carbohydrate-binding family 9-like protein [Armatimonadota bacterium]